MEMGKGGGGGGGGGEVRTVNVVYFLSRGGKVEHPHLIRVHHLHRAGVRLRDVKRWLSELRGKDMADSFAWSYKRRYRSGYVWQDLTDDDLITPISDNEYVLKGSELIPHRPLHPTTTAAAAAINAQSFPPPPPPFSEKSSRVAAAVAEEGEEEEEAEEKEEIKEEEAAAAATTTTTAAEKLNSNPNPNQPPRSAVFKIDACEAVQQQQQEVVEEEEEERGERTAGGSERRSLQSRISLHRASHALRSILTCRVVETNDAVLRPVSRQERSSGAAGDGSQLAAPRRTNFEGRRYDSRKSRSGGGKGTKKMAGEKVGVASAASYKPFGAPYCSQCGKAFNPEKLHSHMKSCKALKARAKGYTNL